MEGSARRRLSGTIAVGALVLAGFSGAPRASASTGPPHQHGTFALLGGTAKITSEFWAVHGSAPLSSTLKVRQFAPGSTLPILRYGIATQRTIHLIVIRDDFATFAHLHPVFNPATGTFSQDFTKDPNHRYYVYADTSPRGIGRQVFRFTLESDGPAAEVPLPSTSSAPSASAGPYTVTLAKTKLPAGRAAWFDLTVEKNGKPAVDLGAYLGIPAHCVFVNAVSLAYVQVRPVARDGPFVRVHVPPLPAGTYKLWVQFRGGAYNLYAVPFTVAVR